MLKEASAIAKNEFHPIVLSGWSAGYGAIREILAVESNWSSVDGVILIDGMHTGYDPEGKPGPLKPEGLQTFLKFAQAAVQGRKRMLVVHSEIFPGTFASTTETADWLLEQLNVKRHLVLKWGPLGTQQISEAKQGNFQLLGFAGNSAPDHVDLLHALAEWLRKLSLI